MHRPRERHTINIDNLAEDFDTMLASSSTHRGGRKRLTARLSITPFAEPEVKFIVTFKGELKFEGYDLPVAISVYNELDETR